MLELHPPEDDYLPLRSLNDLLYCERRCALQLRHDHFVDVTEMIKIGRGLRQRGGGRVAGQQRVGSERHFLMFAGERGVEELEEACETQQRMSAAFWGEGDGGSPFEDVAVVVGKLQEDFGVTHSHDLAGGSLSGSRRSVGQVNAECASRIVFKDCVIGTGVEQAVIGPGETGLRIDQRHGNQRAWAKQSSLK